MSVDSVKTTIEGFLQNFIGAEPFSTSPSAKDIRLKRYVVNGLPIGHEHTTKTMQNLWVCSDDVRISRLKDISHVLKRAEKLSGNTGANSNLFALPEFKGFDLLRFSVRNESEAVRILSEVCL